MYTQQYFIPYVLLFLLWSVLAVDRRSRTREQKITSGR